MMTSLSLKNFLGFLRSWPPKPPKLKPPPPKPWSSNPPPAPKPPKPPPPLLFCLLPPPPPPKKPPRMSSKLKPAPPPPPVVKVQPPWWAPAPPGLFWFCSKFLTASSPPTISYCRMEAEDASASRQVRARVFTKARILVSLPSLLEQTNEAYLGRRSCVFRGPSVSGRPR